MAKSEAYANQSDHWSFQPLSQTKPPEVESDWIRTDLDRYVLAKQMEARVTPSAMADRRTLVRRAYLDLHGLPPTPEQINQFIHDPALDAWQRLIDKLLASPRYGERWGQHWLDLARYADSNGYRYDDNIRWAYGYRDFVIKAFNDDMPFDQFIRWQIAGDELAPENNEALKATGMLAVGPKERNEGTKRNKLENRANELDDIVSTVISSTLALSINCARCHDHKFDPITQQEYYQLTTAFRTAKRTELPLLTEDIKDTWQAANARVSESQAAYNAWQEQNKTTIENIVQQYRDELMAEIEAIESEFVRKNPQLSERKASEIEGLIEDTGQGDLGKNTFNRYKDLRKNFNQAQQNVPNDAKLLKDRLSAASFEAWQSLEDAVKEAKKGLPKIEYMQTYTERTREPEKGHLLLRGDVESLGEELEMGVLALWSNDDHALWQPDEEQKEINSTFQRASVAYWLTDARTGAGQQLARVAANRLWHHHFGEGLVRTPNDFGTQGDVPALPELLDWLALELIDKGWKLSHMHKLIMTSAVYLQGSDGLPENSERDPENRLWWHRPLRRIDAETLRDAMLAIAGRLRHEMGGPGDYLPIPKERIISRLGQSYPSDIKDGPKVWRRSIYAFRKRTVPVPIFQIFDSPSFSECCGKRVHTTVAPQALMLLNDEFVRLRSADLARRLMESTEGDPHTWIEQSFLMTLGRAPNPEELELSLDFFAQQAEIRGDQAPQETLVDYCQAMFGLNEFLYYN